MSARLEAFLARIYTDESAREAYLDDPVGETERAGLEAADRAALRHTNPVDLRLAARSFACKRSRASRRHPPPGLRGHLAVIQQVCAWLGKRSSKAHRVR